jgi:hypothetical protein
MATATAPQPQPAGIWQSMLEALRGTEQDFTAGSISRAVLLLATPMVLEMFMESLFAIVDVFWVSRLGAHAVATVGLTESLLALVFSVAMGVSMSTTAMVARRTGERDLPGAATAAVQAIALGIVIAVLMGVPGYWFASRLLGFMGADAEEKTNSKGSTYTAFSVATKTSWKNADGAWESRTEWHRCVANGKIAGFAATLKKGAHLHVEGELRSREYDNIAECRVGSILKLDRAIRQEEPNDSDYPTA